MHAHHKLVARIYTPMTLHSLTSRVKPSRNSCTWICEAELPSNDEGAAFSASLRACAKNKDLQRGARLHEDVLQRGLLKQCADALILMYAKCGKLAKAKEMLDVHKCSDVFSWTALIGGYVQNGQVSDALYCFECLQREGIFPDAVTYACILKACATMRAVDKGKQIHDEIVRQGLLRHNIMLGNALIDMYAKCGALAKAQQVLEELPVRNVVSWNALIGGYAQEGQGEQALDCFRQMQCEGLSPSVVTFSCILKACGSIGALDKGEQIHDVIAKQGFLTNNIVIGTALVDMYARCGALPKAQQVLQELPVRDIVSWSALIAGYAEQGRGEEALKCFECMEREGLSPNAVTFVSILKACGSIGAIEKGEQIHNKISRKGLLGHDLVLGNALVDMYARCGALAKAEQVLKELPVHNTISWNVLITRYTEQGEGRQALKCFEQMQHEGLPPNKVTFLCLLKACGSIGAADKGEEIHNEIARQGLLGNDIALGNALVDMYARCGALAKARLVLEELHVRDVVSWNSLIAGYAEQGESEQALYCFEQMEHEGLSPNAVTFLCILKACGSIGAVKKGEQIQNAIARQGLLVKDIVLGTALVDMYAKCGELEKAQKVLEELPVRDVVSWSTMLDACQKWGDVKVGRWAFEHAVHSDKNDAAPYVLMGNICTAASMEEDVKNIPRNANYAQKMPG